MSSRYLKSLGKALVTRLPRLYRATLILLTICGLLPLSYGAADVRGDRPLAGEQAKQNRRPNRQGALSPRGILLTMNRVLYRPVIVPLTNFLPTALAYKVACLNGDFRYRLDSAKREEVMRCLEIVLGDQLSLAERANVTRDFIRQGSCLAIDPMRLMRKGEMKQLVEIRGIEHIEAAQAAGKGAIICTSHFGSFICGLSLIGASGFPITAVGRSAATDPSRSAIERFFYRLNVQKAVERHRRPNIEPQGQLEVAVQVAKILKQNELVIIGLDVPLQSPTERARAVPMDFLNGKALLLPGATTIGKLTGAPLLQVFMHRSADWRHQVLEILPPIYVEGDAVTTYKRCLAVVEANIRQQPAHWHYWKFTDLITLGLLSEEAVSSSKG